MALCEAPFGLQIKIFSPTNDLLTILSDTDESGRILNAKIIEKKIGGLDSFKFNISKYNDLAISQGSECYFYIQDLKFIGRIKELPESDQSDPVLEVSGEGFYKRLEKVTINKSYTTQTLDHIVKDIANLYLSDAGLIYNILKIDVPVVSNITIEFKDKNLFQIFNSLLNIANYDYLNNAYRFYIDNEKELVFEKLSGSMIDSLFEGYHYQSPDVSKDNSNMVNKILAFRTKSADKNSVEYVATYQDTESQGKYGIYEIKYTFPDYADTTTISNFCSFILKRRNEPQKKISLSDLLVFVGQRRFNDFGVMDKGSGEDGWLIKKTIDEDIELTSLKGLFKDKLLWGKYAISNKRDSYWQIFSECDSLTGWDFAHITNTTVTIATNRCLTGNRALKIVTDSGSLNEYFEFELDTTIPLPQLVRLFIYFESTATAIKLTFYDNKSNSIDVQLGDSSTINQWLLLSEQINQQTENDNMLVDDGTPNDDFIVEKTTGVETNLDLTKETNPGLLNVKKFRLTILSNTVMTFYLDHIDVYANIYKYAELFLEEIEYNLSAGAMFANASFGEKQDNVIDEIKDKIKEGDIALSIFSKQ